MKGTGSNRKVKLKNLTKEEEFSPALSHTGRTHENSKQHLAKQIAKMILEIVWTIIKMKRK